MRSSFSFVRKVIFTIGFSFLYIPMLVLVFYSFNESRVVNIWTGFSFKWYRSLFHNHQLLKALKMSLFVAFSSASTAVVFGVVISCLFVRFKKFTGKSLLSSFVTAPLVIPDIIIGISLLLFFVLLNQTTGLIPKRGFLTLWLSHTIFCTSYAVIVISARLKDIDKTLENAAMDLGAGPLKTFFFITLPIIMPSLISSWLLAFTLSLDDVVIASFVTGPGSTTLPMVVLSSIKLGVSPEINALAAIIIFVVSSITLLGWIGAKRIENKR